MKAVKSSYDPYDADYEAPAYWFWLFTTAFTWPIFAGVLGGIWALLPLLALPIELLLSVVAMSWVWGPERFLIAVDGWWVLLTVNNWCTKTTTDNDELSEDEQQLTASKQEDFEANTLLALALTVLFQLLRILFALLLVALTVFVGLLGFLFLCGLPLCWGMMVRMACLLACYLGLSLQACWLPCSERSPFSRLHLRNWSRSCCGCT